MLGRTRPLPLRLCRFILNYNHPCHRPFQVPSPSLIMWYRALVVFVYLFLHSTSSFAAPSSSESPLRRFEYTDSDPNYELWTPDSGLPPSPQRNKLGATILGPQNTPLELQNADLLAPPTTDSGDVKNFKWPFSLSHNKLSNGGWARQQNGTILL